MKISENKYITLTYDLNVGDGSETELMEQATVDKPMEFIFGANMMLDAFEKEIEGLEQGSEFSFHISPEESYGDYDDEQVVELPKNIFEIEGKIDTKVLFEGNVIPMMDSSGSRLMGSVVSIDDEKVTMDFNHPLAGEKMYFTGKVLGVREASPDEIAALFSGGGCGCGCGSEGGGCGSENGGSCGCGGNNGSSNGGGCSAGGCGNC